MLDDEPVVVGPARERVDGAVAAYRRGGEPRVPVQSAAIRQMLDPLRVRGVAARPLVRDEAQAVPIGVVCRRAADENGAGGAADQAVGAAAANEDVTPTAAVEMVVPGATDQHVVARGAL